MYVFALLEWKLGPKHFETRVRISKLGPGTGCQMLRSKAEKQGKQRVLKKGEKLHKMRELKVHFLVGCKNLMGH